jgi:predicted transposase/invertase (TIGR01784 family)
MHEHDYSYKLLFSHAAMVEDLLRGFIHEVWVKELDFTTLEKVSGSFISDDLREREDDLIWRVRWRNEWLYVYILLEFQSTVDSFMAVRIMTYLGLLYQDLIKHQQLTARDSLPPVLPLVLYNGQTRWHAARNIRNLIPVVPSGLEKYCPQLEYLVLDEGAFSDSELASLRNLVAALFRLEQSRTVTDIQRILSHLIEWLQAQEQAGLRRDFTVWLRRVILPRRWPAVMLPEIHELQEMHTMLAETVQQWYAEAEEQGMQHGLQRGIQQGLQQGRQEGRQEGQLEGERLLFKFQLQAKFGPLSPKIEEQLDALDAEMLFHCAKRLLTATTIEGVFNNFP